MNLKKEIFEFNLKTKTKFGVGIAVNLAEYLKELSYKKIGLVIDKKVSHTTYAKEILTKIKQSKFNDVIIWKYDLEGEPDYISLDKIKQKFIDKKHKPLVDCFVGIGGGSVIDFAKGLATLTTNPGPAINYRGFPKNIDTSLPTIAIPTTAGTASEVTYNAVFVDKKTNKKKGINTMDNFPVLAIIDPKLSLSCPKSVTLSSGGDAIVHTLESYVAVQSNSYTRIFAKEAFKLLFNNITKVIEKPDDIEVRANLSFGSYLAGISLMNSGSGPAGALSYLIGPFHNVPHGIAGSIFLPYIVKHNVEHGYDYSELYDLIEGMDKSISKKMKSKMFSEKIFETWKKIGIPDSLTTFGINKKNIDVLLKEVKKFEAAFAQNPIPFTTEDGKKLLKKMI